MEAVQQWRFGPVIGVYVALVLLLCHAQRALADGGVRDFESWGENPTPVDVIEHTFFAQLYMKSASSDLSNSSESISFHCVTTRNIARKLVEGQSNTDILCQRRRNQMLNLDVKVDWRTILAIMLGAGGSTLSGAGGVGGGGLFVPLFNIVLGLDSKTSTALSNVMIFSGSFVNLCWNVLQHHPIQSDHPLLDFDTTLLLQPNMLLGISVGVIFNVISPSWLVTALLAVTLSYISVYSFRNALKRWVKESEARISFSSQCEDVTHSVAANVAVLDEEYVYPARQEGSSPSLSAMPLMVGLKISNPEQGADFVRGTSIVISTRLKVGVLILVWFIFSGVQILRGGKAVKTFINIKSCSLEYWLLTASQIPIAIVVTLWTWHRPPRCASKDATSHTDLVPKDRTRGKRFILPFMALMAGLLGGLLGIGGGMIINPLLLTMGMLPQVVAATCSFMVFFTSSLSILQFWLLGRIPLQLGLYSASLCAVFSAVGLIIVKRVIDRYDRPSVIVFAVSCVIGASACLMATLGSWDVWQQYREGDYMGFNPPC